MTVPKPRGFEKYLSDYGPVVFDPTCDEPIGWGFEVTEEMSEERFESLKLVFHVEYRPTVVVVLWLSRLEAIDKYGPEGEVTRGPRMGFKSIMFGETTFSHPMMSPYKQAEVAQMKVWEMERRAYG